MRRLITTLLGLVLLVGAIGFAGYRLGLIGSPAQAPVASRSAQAPAGDAARRPPTERVSGFQAFELALNIANVVVGILGIWMTMRGLRAERRAEEIALRRDR